LVEIGIFYHENVHEEVKRYGYRDEKDNIIAPPQAFLKGNGVGSIDEIGVGMLWSRSNGNGIAALVGFERLIGRDFCVGECKTGNDDAHEGKYTIIHGYIIGQSEKIFNLKGLNWGR